jgi:hypothetical protein
MEMMRNALAAGTLISLIGFALVFWAVSRLLPLILRFEAPPWFLPVEIAIIVLASAAGPLVRLRKHRRKTQAARR